MDSLSQIVLGAAVGEAILGKKIGNRAMVWGAVGGTIPDLDVVSNYFMSEVQSLAFHRGISHSISFSIVGAVLLGWLVHRIYQSQYHKWIAIILQVIALCIVLRAVTFLFQRIVPDQFWMMIPISLGLAFLMFQYLKRKYDPENWQSPDASMRDWQWLFFGALFTHPLLDCFTMYGTQLFAPFTDYRVAFSTISVADPMYTIPFLICLIIASRKKRDSRSRRNWNYAGIIWSCSYLLFTCFNKLYINRVYANSLENQGIEHSRMITNASILNNILWTGTAESNDAYYQGTYSWFDKSDIKFIRLQKDHDKVKLHENGEVIKTLQWFSDGFYNVIDLAPGAYQLNDLRFGTFSGEAKNKDDFIFRFKLTETEHGLDMKESRGGPPDGGAGRLFSDLWQRVKGR